VEYEMPDNNENSIEASSRKYPFDRTNLKVKRQFATAVLEFEGWALPGTSVNDPGWQIASFAVDAQSPPNVLSKDFAQNPAGKESNAFAFIWADRSSLTYGS
jgi:hypothetical protein